MTLKMDNVVEIPELRDKTQIFHDRENAGYVLADMMIHYSDTESIVFGIPAGGVPVAVPIAQELKINLDVAVVSKITLPWNT